MSAAPCSRASAIHSTKWIEDTLDLSSISSVASAPTATAEEAEPRVRRDVDVEVDGRRFKVAMWVPEGQVVSGGRGTGAKRRPRAGAASVSASGGGPGAGQVAAPMQGTIVKLLVNVGDVVEAGQAVCVLEAMKMENQIEADKSGTVAEIKVAAGQTVGGGDVLVVIA